MFCHWNHIHYWGSQYTHIFARCTSQIIMVTSTWYNVPVFFHATSWASVIIAGWSNSWETQSAVDTNSINWLNPSSYFAFELLTFTDFPFWKLLQGIGRLFRCLCNPAFDVDDEEIVYRSKWPMKQQHYSGKFSKHQAIVTSWLHWDDEQRSKHETVCLSFAKQSMAHTCHGTLQ